MFDNDVIFNKTLQETAQVTASFSEKENATTQGDLVKQQAIMDQVASFLKNGNYKELNEWAKSIDKKPSEMYNIVSEVLDKYVGMKKSTILDYVDSLDIESKVYLFGDTKFSIPMGEYKVGEITSGDREKAEETMKIILNQTSGEEKYVSLNPDNWMENVEDPSALPMGYMHGMVYVLPAITEDQMKQGTDKVPAMIQTANGYNFGYLSRENGRFYLQNDKFNVRAVVGSTLGDESKKIENLKKVINDANTPKEQKEAAEAELKKINANIDILKKQAETKAQKDRIAFVPVADTQVAEKILTEPHMKEVGTKAVADYQYAYSSSNTESESISADKRKSIFRQ